jgi:O-antigen/teichoic acid export membrane protein
MGPQPDPGIASQSRVVADTVWLLAARVVVAVLGWSGTILIVRSLSTTSWGQFAFLFNLMSLLFIITNAVGPRVALRGMIERSDPERYAGSYIILRTLLGLVGYGIAIGFVEVAGYPPVVERAMALAGLVVVISATSTAYGIVFQVHHRLRNVAVGQILGQIAQLILTITLAVIGVTMTIFTVPAILCEVVVLVYTHARARRLIALRFVILPGTWWTLLKSALPIAVGQGLFALYANVDSILLSKLQSFAAVGAYGIAYKFSNLVAMVPIALSVAVMATMVSSWPGQLSVFWATFRRSFLIMFLMATVVATEFAVFARPIVQLLYGRQYLGATGAARLVVLGACVSFFTVLATTVLTAQGRNAFYVVAGAVGLVVNVAANLLVIPRWSYQGAALVTVLTEVAVLSVSLPACIRRAPMSALPLRAMVRCVPCAASSVGVAIGLYVIAPWPVAAAAGCLSFFLLAHFFGIPDPRGLRSLLNEPTPGAITP